MAGFVVQFFIIVVQFRIKFGNSLKDGVSISITISSSFSSSSVPAAVEASAGEGAYKQELKANMSNLQEKKYFKFFQKFEPKLRGRRGLWTLHRPQSLGA